MQSDAPYKVLEDEEENPKHLVKPPQLASKRKKQPQCQCGQSCTRKLLRILILVVLTCIVLFLPWFIIEAKVQDQTYTLKASKNIQITYQNCQLIFSKDNSVNPDEPQLDIRTAKRLLASEVTFAETDTNILVFVSNALQYSDGCLVTVRYHYDTIWSDFEISGAWNQCSVIHESPNSPLRFKKLIISGREVDINFLEVEANYINIEVIKGVVQLNQATIQQDSVIKTWNGDVIYQSASDFGVFWRLQNSYYCLGVYEGAAIDVAKKPVECWLDRYNTTASRRFKPLDKGNCTASYALCAQTGCKKVPNITMWAINGNIYANLLPPKSPSLGKNVTTVMTAPFDIGLLKFTEAFGQQVASMNTDFSDRSKRDEMLLFKVGNYRGRSSAAAKVAVSPNAAYVDMRPWWMSFISASLLLDFPLEASGRLQPGFCPFRTSMNGAQLASLLFTFKKAILQPNQVVDIWNQGLGQISDDFLDSPGYLPSITEDQWTRANAFGDVLLIRKANLSDNPVLFTALIISLALGFVLAILGLIAFIQGLYALFVSFSLDSQHIQNYVRLTGSKITEMERGFVFEDTEANSAWVNIKTLPPTWWGKVKLTLRNLPPPFALIDHLVFIIHRSVRNSFKQYCQVVFTKTTRQEAERQTDAFPMAQFKVEYERFCFLQKYDERLVTAEENLTLLYSYGFEIVRRMEGVEYRRIRFLTDSEERMKREFREQKLATLRKKKKLKNIDTVGLFLQMNCARTKFEVDTIPMIEFKRRYQDFCLSNRLPSVNIDPSLMSSYGIASLPIETSFLVRRDDSQRILDNNGKSLSYYNLNISKAAEINHEIIRKHLREEGIRHPPQSESSFTRTRQFADLWMLFDILSVLFHLATLLFFTLIPVITVAASQSMRAQYSTSAIRDILAYQDFVYTPWNIPRKLHTLRAYDQGILIASAVYVVLALVQLVSYYLWISFPLDTLQYFKPLKDVTQNKEVERNRLRYNIIRRISQSIQWVYIFLFVSAILWYFAVLLVWAILAAVINPKAYLYIATAAATFVVYIGVKYTQLQDAQRRGWTNTLLILEKKTRRVINEVVKKIILSFDSDDQNSKALEATLAASASGNMGKLEEATIKYIYTTPLGRKMRRDDFDVKLVLRSIKGDQSAVSEFARDQKLNKHLIELIISQKTLKKGEARNHLKTILSTGPFSIDLDIVELIECLKLDRSNMTLLFSTIAQSFKHIVKNKLQVRHLNINSIPATFPPLMNAVMCLIRNETEDFLTNFSAFNVAVQVSYRQYALTLKQFSPQYLQEIPIFTDALNSPSYAPIEEIFDDNKKPKFLFPSYLMSVLKLSLLPSADSLTERQIKACLMEVLKSRFEISNTAVQFFEAVFGGKTSQGLNTAEELLSGNSKLVEEFSKEKGLEPLLLNSAFKIAFRDRSFAQAYIQELNRTVGVTSIPVELGSFQVQFITIALGVFSIIFTQNLKLKLLNAAQSCELDKEAAESIMTFSSQFNFPLIKRKFQFNLSESLLVTRQVASGLISLLKGEFESNNFIDVINLFCQKQSIPSSMNSFIWALYAMIHSRDPRVVLDSIKILNLEQYQTFILIGKNLLHPKYIEKEELESILKRNRNILEERMDLPFNEESLQDWTNKVAWSIRIDMKIRDQISDMRSQYSQFESEQKSEQQGVLDTQASPIREKDIQIELVQIRHFRSFKQKRKQVLLGLLVKFLRFKKEIKSAQFISRIFKEWKKIQITKPDPIQDSMIKSILQLIQLRPISSKNSRQSLKTASRLLSELLGLPYRAVWALVSLVGLNKEITDDDLEGTALSLTYGQIGPKKRYSSVLKFLKAFRLEISLSQNQSKGVESLSTVLGLPKCLISSLLMPYCRRSSQIALNDVCYLFDLASFHDSYFISHNLKQRHYNVSLQNMKLLFANLFIGNLPSVFEIQKVFNIDNDLAQILTALCTMDKSQKLQIIVDFLRKKFTEMKIPSKHRETITALFSLFSSDSEGLQFKLEELHLNSKKIKKIHNLSAPAYLAQLTRIPVAFFEALVSAFLGNIKESYEQLKQFRGPFEILPDILTVAQGSLTKTKFLEQKLQLSRDLIAVCILLARFSRNSKFQQNLRALQQSEEFGRFCREQVIVQDVFINLLRLSSGQIKSHEIQEAFNIFQLYNHCEKKFIKAILSISQGSLTSELFKERDINIAYKLRSKHIKELEKNVAALCEPFGLPLSLAVIGARLRQGDFLVIQDKKEYLAPFLPDASTRKLAMSLCGILRCPVHFNLNPAKYPNVLSYPANFEGALHHLTDVFGINPLVFRLCFFDKEALDYVERKFKIPSQVLIAFIMTLDNLSGEIIDMLLEKDLYRNAYEKIERAKYKVKARIQKEMSKRAKQIAKIEKQRLRSLKVLKPEKSRMVKSASQNILSPQLQEEVSESRESRNSVGLKRRGTQLSQNKISTSELEEGAISQINESELLERDQILHEHQEISSESLSQVSKEESSDDWDQEGVESDVEINSDDNESDQQEVKEELASFQKKEFDPMNTKYDKIDFRSKKYEHWYKEILQVANLFKEEGLHEEQDSEQVNQEFDFQDGGPQLNPESEVIECVIFNTPEFANYSYNSAVQIGLKEKVVGTKSKWDLALASCFLKDNRISALAKEAQSKQGNSARKSYKKLTQFTQYNWLRKGDRSKINNIWQIFKRLMKSISKDKKSMNSGAHGFSRIHLSHFILANALYKVRRILAEENQEGEINRFAQATLQLEQVLTWVERNSIFSGRFTRCFHPNHILKIVGIALNLKYSNYFDYFPSWRAQLYDDQNYPDFNEFTLRREEDLEMLIGKIQGYFKELRAKKKIHGMSLYEVEQFLITPDRKEKYIELFKSAYLQEKRNVREQWPKTLPRFQFQVSNWRKQIISKQEEQFSRLVMIVPKEIENAHQQVLDRKFSIQIEDYNLNESIHQSDQRAIRAFQQFEQYVIAEPEPMDLICGIAQNNQNVWSKYTELLKIVNIIKKDSAVDVYKAFQGLIHIKSDTKAKKQDESQDKFSLKQILTILAGNQGEQDSLLENLLELAHGKINQSSLNLLSSRFNTSPTVLRFFFLSAFLQSGITESKISRILTPLAQLLGTTPTVLVAITRNKHQQLWETIVSQIKLKQARIEANEFRKVKSLKVTDIIEKIIAMINWDKLQVVSEGNSEVMDVKHSERKLLEIVDLLDASSATQYKENKTLKLLIKLANYIQRNELSKLLATVEKLGILLNRSLDTKSMSYFRALCVLTGNFKLRSKDKSILIKEARKSLASRLSQQVVSVRSKTKITQAVQEMRKKAKGLIELLFGFKYKLKACEEAGAKAIGGKFLKIYTVLRNIQHFKLSDYKTENEEFRGNLRMSLTLLTKIIDSFINSAVDSKQTLRLEESETQLKELPVSREWSIMQKLAESFQETYKNYEIILPPLQGVSGAQSPIKGRANWQLKKEPVPQVFHISLLAKLMEGDVHQFLELLTLRMQGNGFDGSGSIMITANLAHAIANVIQMTRQQFIGNVMTLFEGDLRLPRWKSNDYSALVIRNGKEQKHLLEFAQLFSQLLNPTEERKEDRAHIAADDPQRQVPSFLIKYSVFILLGLKFDRLNEEFLPRINNHLLKYFLESTQEAPLTRESFQLLMSIVFGREELGENKLLNLDQKLRNLVKLIITQYYQDLQNASAYLRTLFRVLECLANGEKMLTPGSEGLIVLSDLLHLDMDLLVSVGDVLQGDDEALVELAAAYYLIDGNTLSSLIHSIQQVVMLLQEHQEDIELQKAQTIETKFREEQWKDLVSRIAVGKATYRDLFDSVDADGDQSGGISRVEFTMLLKRLQLPCSEHRVEEIFTRVKPNGEDGVDGVTAELNYDEFEEAMKFIEQKQAYLTLRLLGISTQQLVWFFIGLTVILLLMFVFIFLGVQALSISGDGAFGSVINSMLPVGSGVLLMQQKKVDPQVEMNDAKDSIVKVNDIVKSES